MSQHSTCLPKSGHLLISEPFLQDENFVRSVVLVCDHNEKGSFGLVLNKLSILKLGELFDDLESLDIDVYVGGPVEQDTLHFIFSSENPLEGSIQLGEGLWWGGDFDQLVTRLNNAELCVEDVRIFIGYSGWTAGQLNEELAENTWIICESIDGKDIFHSSPEELWRIILTSMGREYQMLANYPIDPRLN
jgi:putative transcriptional regulator